MPIINDELVQMDAFAAIDGSGAFGAYIDEDNETCWLFQYRKGGFAHCNMEDGSVIFQGNIFNDNSRLIDYHGQGTPFWAQDGENYYSAVSGVLYKLTIGASSLTSFGNGYLLTESTLDLTTLGLPLVIEGWTLAGGYLVIADSGSNRMIAVNVENMQIVGAYSSSGIPLAAPFRDIRGYFWCAFAMPDKSVRLACWPPGAGAFSGVLNVSTHNLPTGLLGTNLGVKCVSYIPQKQTLFLGNSASAYTGQQIAVSMLTFQRTGFRGDNSKDFFSTPLDAAESAMQIGAQPTGRFAIPADTGNDVQVGGVVNLIDPVTLGIFESYDATADLVEAGVPVPTAIQAGRGPTAIPTPFAMMSYNFALDRMLITYQPQGSPAYSVKVGVGPPPVGQSPGLTAIRNYCQAYGIFVSGVMDTQKTASDWLSDLADIANAYPVWNGSQLNFVPRCEVSAVGNGAIYIAPTASGPVDFLDDSVFVQKNAPPVTITRIRSRVDKQNAFNVLPIEHIDRSNQYNHRVTTIRDQGDIFFRGSIPATTRQLLWIHDAQTATKVAWPLLRRSTLIERLSITFTLPITRSYLDPADLVGLTEQILGLVKYPVRLTDVSESETFELQCTAEPFYYGAHAPTPQIPAPIPVTGWTANQQADPGNVNPPIIFEPVKQLNTYQNQGSLMFIVCGSSPNYGGCNIHMSTDGGNTYQSPPVGTLQGNPAMGQVFSADFPAIPDPDTTTDLFVDLTESSGALSNFPADQRDLFQSVCYLQGGGTQPGGHLIIPYELVAYANANLITGNQYDLPPTIRRGVFGTPIADHPIGSLFSFIDKNELVSIPLNPSLIGVQLFFKFTAFNVFLQNEQDIADVTAYTYTPIGIGSLITFEVVFLDKWLGIEPEQFERREDDEAVMQIYDLVM